jgi:hypothetical protein
MTTQSRLGQHRPSYTWTCGICGQVIHGKSNTIHLGIYSHIRKEFKEGKRGKPFSSRADSGVYR